MNSTVCLLVQFESLIKVLNVLRTQGSDSIKSFNVKAPSLLGLVVTVVSF